MNNIYDVIIIGSGPSGMSASIYASKANLKTLVIEESYPGGKIVNTSFIENYPGEKRIPGYELANQMFEHLLSYGSEYVTDKVIDIKINDSKIKEVIGNNQSYFAKAVIIAIGNKEKKLNVPGESQFYGKGISYCAVCDGSLYKGEDMVVVGGGNSALQEALYLTNFSNKITLIHRRDNFSAEASLITKVLENPKIEILYNSEVVEFKGEENLNSIIIRNTLTNKNHLFKTNVVFLFIGSAPDTGFLKNLNLEYKNSFIVTDEYMRTNVEGIFSCGDVNNKHLRQIVTATSDGAIAAMSVYKYLNK